MRDSNVIKLHGPRTPTKELEVNEAWIEQAVARNLQTQRRLELERQAYNERLKRELKLTKGKKR
jgi:hypothetical protein